MILEGWKELTQEEIIENIKHGQSLIQKEDNLSFFETELSRLRHIEKFGHIERHPDITRPFNTDYAFRETINNSLSNLRTFAFPILREVNEQSRIDELEKILRKHPNRSDVRMELMKLKKTVKPKIGRKKKRT